MIRRHHLRAQSTPRCRPQRRRRRMQTSSSPTPSRPRRTTAWPPPRPRATTVGRRWRTRRTLRTRPMARGPAAMRRASPPRHVLASPLRRAPITTTMPTASPSRWDPSTRRCKGRPSSCSPRRANVASRRSPTGTPRAPSRSMTRRRRAARLQAAATAQSGPSTRTARRATTRRAGSPRPRGGFRTALPRPRQ